jgi:putative transposase
MKEYKKREQAYPSDLSDAQWEEIKPLFLGMREYTWPKRELLDAVLYFVKTGCQWRHLPHDFPPYSTVHSFYRRARKSGLWDAILEHMVEKTRKDAGRSANPTYGLIDSQSVKTTSASEERGIDGGKKQKAGNVTSL